MSAHDRDAQRYRGPAIRTHLIRIAVIAVLVLILVTGGWQLHQAGFFDRGYLATLADEAGWWGPGVIIGAMILAVVVGPIPTIPVSVASGLVFGGPAGFTYALAGALIGAVAAFWIARLAGRPLIARLLGGDFAFCPECSDRLLFWVVLAARLVPVISFALVSYAAGLTAMRTRAFALATLLGMTPMTALYVGLGAALTVDPLWTLACGLIVAGLMITLPHLVERYNPFGLADLLAQARGRPRRTDPDG